jgi:nicotinamidase/pyrazinamidase
MKALILVDIQNDFLPGGALAVPDGDAILAVANRLQGAFELVVATQDWHPANHGSFAVTHPGKKVFEQIELRGLPQTLWPMHCVQNTPGADLATGLKDEKIARVFPKGTDSGIDSYSGFFDNGHRKSTGLGEWLKEQGVDEVFVCGLATDYCVRFTALDAVKLGFRASVIEDACRGVSLRPGDVAEAIAEVKRAGAKVVQSADVLGDVASEAERTTLHRGKFLALIREGHWEYAERIGTTGAAIIVAVTNEKKLLLVEQYRIPVHSRTIELPAGIVGDEPGAANESLADAARRELLEETGYAAETMKALMTGPSSSGLASEMVTLLLASGLKRVHQGGGIAHERIVVHEVPVAEVHEWLAAKVSAGFMVEPKVYAGLYFLARGCGA